MDQFTWAVDLDGYDAFELSKDDADDEVVEWVMAQRGYFRQHSVRVYAPLVEAAGLHRTFAALKPTLSDAIGFVNRFGLLGHPVTRTLSSPRAQGPVREIRGELLADWIAQSQELDRVLRLWDTVIGASDLDLRSKQVPRQDSGSIKEVVNTRDRDLFGRISNGDVKSVGDHIQDVVNDRLDSLEIRARLVWNFDRTTLKNALMPRSLLGAIWVDLALAIGANKTQDAYQMCASCGTFFEKSLGKRRDARYCSDACKSRAYRRRVTIGQL